MDIIEKLRDDEEYYSGVGKYYLSNSDIGVLLSNPLDFRKRGPDNKNYATGRYFHQSLLEPDKAKVAHIVDVSTRTTKEYKQYLTDNAIEFAMLKKEIEEVDRLVAVMRGNITFFDEIYREGNQYEVPNVGNLFGVEWKGKADIVTHDSIIDIKTTSDINKFKWSAKSYNYDSQCYIYQELFGKPLVFYVIDKETAQLGVFRPSENFINGGKEKVKRAIEIYNRFFGKDAWDDISNHYIQELLD